MGSSADSWESGSEAEVRILIIIIVTNDFYHNINGYNYADHYCHDHIRTIMIRLLMNH